MNISKILKKIKIISYSGNLNLEINTVVALQEAISSENAITWCSDANSDQLKKLNTTAIVIVSSHLDITINNNLNYLIVENPRRIFQEILTLFFNPKQKPSISKTAIIAASCEIGNDVFIGHGVVIEENSKVGNNVTILHNSIILKNTIIGNNVTIGANNTIGGVGFGYEKNEHGDFELIPHIGNVIIHNHVDIGNNTCIDRAVLGSTILHENVKVDNLVHIAHGVVVGRNSVIIANAMVAGSVVIGENVWVAPSSAIINKKNIGSNALIGLGAIVTKDVANDDVVAGNPAKSFKKKVNI